MIKIFKYFLIFTLFSINLKAQPIPTDILDQEDEEILMDWITNETDYPDLSIILNNKIISTKKAKFINAILRKYKIRTLDLAYCNITEKNLKIILKALRNVTIMLNLSGIDIINKSLAKYLNLSSIQILKLSNCKINNSKIKKLFNNFNNNLISLDLSHNLIGNKGSIFLLKKIFQNNLTHLNLSYNKLKNKALQYFIENHQSSKLKSFSLAYNPINDQNLLQNLLQTKILSSICISGISLRELVQSVFTDADSRDQFIKSLGPEISLLNIRDCDIQNHLVLLLENIISRLACFHL